MEPLLRALSLLQKADIYHRDINPSNIFITENSRYGVMLIDFGLACFREEYLKKRFLDAALRLLKKLPFS